MRKKIWFLVVLALIGVGTYGLFQIDIGTVAVMVPMGDIAAQEKKLLVDSTLLMMIIIVPVFFVTIWIGWRYRASNKKAKYDPNWENNNWAEFVYWFIPCVVVTVLSVWTWKSCYDLNPFKPLSSSVKPLRIQVVALQWKWLFIYPDYNIASVNWVQFPKETPLNFEITSDAPMNSFWIPQLGGQIYAMPAMRSKLHLIAHEEGTFKGSSANLSGKGFSGMIFQARACSQEEFESWVQKTKGSSNVLNQATYKSLAEPSENNPVTSYVLQKDDLFESIIMKYMMPMDN